MHKPFILATAGHVDHGKTSLVKALTDISTDRLPEEQKRGITIDLGFAHLALPDPEDPESDYSIGVVDVPGHEDFVKNMVAGVGSIDLALLVVAADDGWMPQTEEHVQILEYLGVTQAVVALTKIDLISDDQDFYVELVREELERTQLAGSTIVKTSIHDPESIEQLKAAILALAQSTPGPRDIQKPRLPIDRVFTIQGAGKVVTGTLTGGGLVKDQEVMAGTGTYRIRSIQQHNHACDVAIPGTRTALNLVDARGANPKPLARGDLVCLPESNEASTTWHVLLEKCGRSGTVDFNGALRPIKHNIPIWVHHGSGHSAATIFLLNSKTLKAGEQGIAELRFQEPVVGFTGDRFVLRDWSEQTTLAGGLVLDPQAVRRTFRRPGQRNFLLSRAEKPHDLVALAADLLERDHAASGKTFLRNSIYSPDEIADALSQLESGGGLLTKADGIVKAAWWKELLHTLASEIIAFHQANPERPGFPISTLHTRLTQRGLEAELHEAIMQDLVANGHERSDSAIRKSDHQPELPEALRAIGRSMRGKLEAAQHDPPSRKELCPDEPSEKVGRFFIAVGDAVELGDNLIMLRSAYEELAQSVLAYIRDQGPASASDLRKHLNVSRRIAIPLLEYMDSRQFTQRDGDLRVLGSNG